MASFRAAGDQIVPFSNMRRRTAEHMVRSKATSPHAFIANEVDFESVERVRKAWGERFKAEEGFALTYLPFVARAAVEALRDFPLLNASVVDDSLLVHAEVNLGIAVDLSHEGLIVPVIHRAEEVTLRGVARRIRDLAERARGRQLNADDIAGGTFSITNDGPFGTYFTVPIINQPQVAILATDGIARRPVVVTQPDGSESIAIHSTGILGVSWDHRAVDGAYVSLFLAKVASCWAAATGPRSSKAAPVLRVRSLGTVPYHEAYALQHALATEAADDYLLVLQHPHTYTLGAHADERHVLVDPAAVGAVLERTDRGGDVTYHGPGQLVAYPIVTVPDDPASGPAHVHRLEQVVIATLADLGLTGATTEDEYPGVWLDAGAAQARKIAAIGVRTLRAGPGRRRTLHGVALNVASDLAMFGHIVPCGIADRGVTSLAAEGIDVPFGAVVDAFVARATAVFGAGERGAPRRGARARPICSAYRPRGSARSCAACARPGWHPRRASTSGSASRTGCGCPCASARATASSGPPSTISGSSPCARRRDARTSTSAGPTARRPS